MNLRTTLLGAGIALALAVPAQAQAQSADQEIGLEILKVMVEEGLIPQQKADDIVRRARAQADARRAQAPGQDPAVIDVPYVPETVRKQIAQEVRAEVMEQARNERWAAPDKLPGWLDRIELSGDVRVRYQGEYYDERNFPSFPDINAINQAGGVTNASGFPLMNSTIDRNQGRYRARLGVVADVADTVRAGIRLASGSDGSAISTNDSMGPMFQKDGAWVDRAWVSYRPIEELALTAGRMPNPFFSTDLVWDEDINPEGVALRGDFGLADGADVFATLGMFPLSTKSGLVANEKNRWLQAAQIGAGLRFADTTDLRLGLAYYDFRNVQSSRNLPDGSRLMDHTAPRHLAKGNSVFNMRTDGTTTLAGLASRFELANLTASARYTGLAPVNIGVTADYVRNLGFDAAEIAALRGEPGVKPERDGWQLKVDVGHDRFERFGDWQVAAAYKRIGTDAVLDIFTDSDFGLGGTDVKGYRVEGSLGLAKDAWMTLRWFSTDAIQRPPFSIDVLQIDFNAAF